MNDKLRGTYTDALESIHNQLKPLGSAVETVRPTQNRILDNKAQSVPAAKLTEQHEYRNAESIEDNHG